MSLDKLGEREEKRKIFCSTSSIWLGKKLESKTR
jgi:hypothetical protein